MGVFSLVTGEEDGKLSSVITRTLEFLGKGGKKKKESFYVTGTTWGGGCSIACL